MRCFAKSDGGKMQFMGHHYNGPFWSARHWWFQSCAGSFKVQRVQGFRLTLYRKLSYLAGLNLVRANPNNDILLTFCQRQVCLHGPNTPISVFVIMVKQNVIWPTLCERQVRVKVPDIPISLLVIMVNHFGPKWLEKSELKWIVHMIKMNENSVTSFTLYGSF